MDKELVIFFTHPGGILHVRVLLIDREVLDVDPFHSINFPLLINSWHWDLGSVLVFVLHVLVFFWILHLLTALMPRILVMIMGVVLVLGSLWLPGGLGVRQTQSPCLRPWPLDFKHRAVFP